MKQEDLEKVVDDFIENNKLKIADKQKLIKELKTGMLNGYTLEYQLKQILKYRWTE